MLTIRPLAAALNKHRHRLSASPCRADGAKGAARPLSVTPYPARKEPAPVARLRPSNYPAKRCRVVSGRLRLVITIATKNQVNPSADTRFAVTASALRLLSSHDVPFPGATSLRLDAPGTGTIPNDFLPASGTRLTTAARRQAHPSGKGTFLCPVPADFASLRLPVLGPLRGRLRVLRTLRSSAQT